MRHRLMPVVIAAMLAGGIGPALAATVDAAAKPYFVLGGWVAVLAFGALGTFVFRKGAHHRKLAAAIAGWPTADGRVLESDVREIERSDTDGGAMTLYVPHVRYAYKVAGVAHESAVIRVGLSDFGRIKEPLAREHANGYPVGATVPVRYDPNDPTQAVLEVGQIGGFRYGFAGTLFLLLALAAVVFSVWSMGLDAR